MERYSAPVTFVQASSAHVAEIKNDMERIRGGGGVAKASTQAGIIADLQSSAQHGSTSSQSALKRSRDDEAPQSLSLEHCSVMQLLFPHPQLQKEVSLLELGRTEDGAAVAFLLPMKWSFVHVVIVPVLPKAICYGMDAFPRGWDTFLAKTSTHSDVRLRCLAAMVELRNRVTSLLCSSESGLESILMRGSLLANLHGRCGDLRWSGREELAKARQCFSKKRSDGALVCPIRVGFAPRDCDSLVNAPALHVLSSDGYYAANSALLWHSAFSAAFEDAGPRGSMEADVSRCLQVVEREAALTLLERMALRKRLGRCSDVPCPLCAKQFGTIDEASRHWHAKCLPFAAASVQIGTPLFL